jgi:hypothetical protein
MTTGKEPRDQPPAAIYLAVLQALQFAGGPISMVGWTCPGIGEMDCLTLPVLSVMWSSSSSRWVG